jgi:hypothetical protein
MNKEKIEAILQKNIIDKTGVLNSITPNAVADTVQEITDLLIDIIEMKIIIYHSLNHENLTPGTSLIPGNWYRINNYTQEDDFSNVGGVNDYYCTFKATGSTPAIWTTTDLSLVTTESEVVFNNTNAIIRLDYDFITDKLTFQSNIDLFYLNKVSDQNRMLYKKEILSPKELCFYPKLVTNLNIYK